MPYKNTEQHRQAKAAWYQKNKEKSDEATRARKLANKRWLDEQKKSPCLDCAGAFHTSAMHFHHRDPATKEMGLAKAVLTRGRAFLSAEIAKCDLICANCHAVREWSDNSRYK